MSNYPDGITHVIRTSGCQACAGREYYAVSAAQASEQVEYLEGKKDSKCTAKFSIHEV